MFDRKLLTKLGCCAWNVLKLYLIQTIPYDDAKAGAAVGVYHDQRRTRHSNLIWQLSPAMNRRVFFRSAIIWKRGSGYCRSAVSITIGRSPLFQPDWLTELFNRPEPIFSRENAGKRWRNTSSGSPLDMRVWPWYSGDVLKALISSLCQNRPRKCVDTAKRLSAIFLCVLWNLPISA